MVLINDAQIMDIPLQEQMEDFTNLSNLHPGIIVDLSMNQIASKSKYFSYTRNTVADKLVEAVQYLPDEYDFYIKEAYRALNQQTKSFNKVLKHYSEEYPELNEEELYRETCKYVAPPECAPHPTGAAIDITLIDKLKNELDMGTPFNATPKETNNATSFDSDRISEKAKEYRQVLKVALEKVGFVNYPPEWWHWSYGDRYWAYMNNEPNAFYSVVDESEI